MSNPGISIVGLTTSEKLNLMERLWVDLSKNPSDIPASQWHGEVLAKRLKAVEDGDVEFVDWVDAKRRLQQRYQ